MKKKRERKEEKNRRKKEAEINKLEKKHSIEVSTKRLVNNKISKTLTRLRKKERKYELPISEIKRRTLLDPTDILKYTLFFLLVSLKR